MCKKQTGDWQAKGGVLRSHSESESSYWHDIGSISLVTIDRQLHDMTDMNFRHKAVTTPTYPLISHYLIFIYFIRLWTVLESTREGRLDQSAITYRNRCHRYWNQQTLILPTAKKIWSCYASSVTVLLRTKLLKDWNYQAQCRSDQI